MDYKRTLLKFIFISFAISIISACDTEISPEPLSITGIPPDLLYYDAEFKYEFGASGGDGVYRYRYIQDPDIDGNAELEANPVVMNIEVVDSAKGAFILRGVPTLPAETPEQLNNQKHKYQIELTDGKHTVTRDFEFTLSQNKLKFSNQGSVREGVVTNTVARNLLAQLELGDTRICTGVKESSYEKYLTPNGYAYPYVLQVIADAQVASKTEIFYRFETSYNESFSEKDKKNASQARKNVDYIDAERSIVLEPGMISCVAYIDLLDDKIIEDKESVSIEFFNHKGGALDYSSARVKLEISDDEILPGYVSKNIVRNVGDKIFVPITISQPVDYPVTINFSVDSSETTAGDGDYIIEPSSGVVTINPGELVSSFSVSLLEESSAQTVRIEDKKITLTTDLDDLLNVDPFTIEINEWSDSVEIDSEIVGYEANDEQVVDFISDVDGVITTLIKSISSANETTTLRSYNRDSSPIDFYSNGIFKFSKIGVNVSAQAIVSETNFPITQAAVILNVDGLFGDIFRGNTDFVVALFEKESGGVFDLISVKQFGTEGDDIVSGARIFNGTLYVYGKTNGLNFEGKPSFETNNGGEDGFLYALNLGNNSFKWARFIGTSAQDNIVSIDSGNKDLIALVSTRNSDEDAFVRKVSTSTGFDIEEDQPAEINTLRDDRPVSVRFDSSSSSFRLLLDSDAGLDFVDKLTSSLTRDVQLIPYDSDNKSSTSLKFATDQEDIAKSLENMPDNLNVIISGNTFGEMDGNIKKGINGADIFSAILGTESLNNTSGVSTLQYGTPADDSLIAVKPISNTKFFVLWSEKFTDPVNQVYRISAFSIDGEKLSRDPE